MTERSFSKNGKSVVISNAPWYDLPVDALVLSANNQLILKGASGLAKWLAETCPGMHDVVQHELRKVEPKEGRGLTFGSGLTIGNGPHGKSVIHAVTVDYDHIGVSNRYASVASVTAATEFALMCTRGHAEEFLPNEMAKQQLPLIQLQTIFGMLAVSGNNCPERVFITTYSPQQNDLERENSKLLVSELDRLLSLYDAGN